ncbi:MAG: hypothetical protein DHS20C19_13360 [Acidimicrobiales bacterium]|nr:MAG: hypothetical protein DHS20C19_13360 [Acidimicrobiales bacterium]
MPATGTAAPSRKLLAVLAMTLVLAAATVGRSFVSPADDGEPDDYFDTFDFVDDGGAERIVIDAWEPPTEPRDPFLQVDLGFASETDEFDDTAP